MQKSPATRSAGFTKTQNGRRLGIDRRGFRFRLDAALLVEAHKMREDDESQKRSRRPSGFRSHTAERI